MASGAGVSAATSQLDQIRSLMNLFLGMASGNSNISSAAFNQFFQGQGPFSSPFLGANGSTDLLQQLQNFRNGLTNPLTNLQLPPQMSALMSQLNGPMGMLQQIIGQNGQTADTQDIRDKLNQIFNQGTGNQAALSQFANGVLGNFGMTGSSAAGLDAALNAIKNGGFNANLDNLANVGGAMVSQRGYGPETQGALDFFSNIMQSGGRDAGTQNLVNTGQGLVSSNGLTPQMSQLMNYVVNGIGQGGSSPQIEDLINQGKSLVSQGGFTSPMTAFLQQIYNGIGQGGMTPQAQQLFGKMMDIVNNNGQGGALLPMDTVASMARNSAATDAANAAEAARRSAFQRTGGAIGSGTTEQALASFSDQNLRNQADALQKAVTSQQGLQLQQLMGASGTASDLTKSATGLLGQLYGAGSDLFKTAASNVGAGAGMMTAGNEDMVKNLASYLGLGGDLSKAAASNISTGAGLMGTGEQLAAQRMGQGIGGFQDTITNTLNRLKAASDMITGANQSANQRLFGGLGSINDLTNGATNSTANAASILNNLTNQSLTATQGLTGLGNLESNNASDAYRNLAGLLGLGNTMYTGQQNAALSSNAQMLDAMLKSMGISSDISNSFSNQWFGAANGMSNIAQMYSSLIPSSMNAYGNITDMLIKASMQPGFWSTFGGNLLNGLVGGLTGGLGGLMTSGIGGLFKGSPGSTGMAGISGGGRMS